MRKKANQESEIGVHKYEGYTMMQNHHLRNKGLSLKAVGLLSKILSFFPMGVFPNGGFSAIMKSRIFVPHPGIYVLRRKP